MTAPISHDVKKIFDQAPRRVRDRLYEIRHLVLAAAEAEDIGSLEETLKWGEPAYLPRRKRLGTTIRLGWSEGPPAQVSIYVHCQTTLIDSYRTRFPDGAIYEGNRAVHLALDAPLDTAMVQQMAALALTYHRNKARR